MVAWILLKQISIMFLLMGVGYALYKLDYISEQGNKDLGAILLRAVIPCVIIRSCFTEYSNQKFVELGISALLALLSLLIAMVISGFFFRKDKSIENFAASFCNVGFIGIPLAQAVFGDDVVFYIAAYIALLNLFQWTYGVYIITGDAGLIQLKKLVINPVLIATLIGLLCFITPVKIPEILSNAVGAIANINTPLALIVLGVYLAKINLKEILTDKRIYLCMCFRLIIIPLITLGAFWLLPISNTRIVMSVLIAVCTPVGTNVVIYAQQYDGDYQLAIKSVCLSTILSIVTIPFYFSIVQMVYK